MMKYARAHNEANAPGDLNAEYYAQRSSAVLIIFEESQISGQATSWNLY